MKNIIKLSDAFGNMSEFESKHVNTLYKALKRYQTITLLENLSELLDKDIVNAPSSTKREELEDLKACYTIAIEALKQYKI